MIADLTQRFADERLDAGVALGELVIFAAGHPQRTMLLAYLLAERLGDGRDPTASLAGEVIEEAIRVTEPSHQAVWQAADASERIVLAAVADGVAPSSRSLAADHDVARTTLANAAERLAAQGHLVKEPRASRVIDPLFAEWLRRR